MKDEKWVVVYDTICTGHQAVSDAEGNPFLYASEAEALLDIQSDIDCHLIEEGEDWPMLLSEYQEGHKTIWYPNTGATA